MSALVTAAVVTAGAAAYGAYSSNKAQKEAAKQQRSAAEAAAGPRTNTPYGPAQEGIDFAIEEARRLYDAGLHQQAAKALRKVPGASEAFSSLVGDVTNRARNPSPTLAAGQGFVQDILGGGSAPPPAGLTEQDVQGAKRFWSPGDTAQDAIRKATRFAEANPQSALGQRLQERNAAAASAGPSGPFARNPIYNELYGAASGTNMDRSFDLLSDFIGGGGGAGFTPGGGSLKPAGGDQGAPAPAAPATTSAGRYGATRSASSLYGGTPSAPAPTRGGVVPDTMAQGGFFADEARKFFDPSVLDPANDPTMQPYLDALRREMEEQFEGRADLIGDRFSSSNMFSGSGRALALGEASGEMDEALSAEIARTLFGSREAALARQMGLLGEISNRDLTAMGDLTDRYGIDTSASVAREGIGASSAAARAAQDAELGFRREALGAETDLATRAQNLQAILGIQGGDEFGMNILAGLGGALDQEHFGALGAIPGLEGTEQDWYGMALGGEQARSGQNQAAGRARASAGANAALAPGADLDDYLRRIMGPGTAFSTQTGTPPSGPYYSGPSSGEALAGGLLGGAAAGLGTYLQYSGGQQRPPTTQSYDYYGDAY